MRCLGTSSSSEVPVEEPASGLSEGPNVKLFQALLGAEGVTGGVPRTHQLE